MRSISVINCSSVPIYHLISQIENSFIYSLYTVRSWRNGASAMKQTLKEKKNKQMSEGISE